VDDEIGPLAQRLGILQGLRTAIAVLVVLFALVSPASFAVPVTTVATATLVFVLATGGVELARRRLRSRGWPGVTFALLADGVYLTLIVMWTGETTSPLLPAAYVTLVAVTMLLSYRTGLKIALWFALLFCAADAAAASGWIATLDDVATPVTRVAATVGTFLLFSITTALFSSFNERALRRSRRDLRALADLGLALELEIHEPGICAIVAERTVADFGFARAAVLSLHDETTHGVVHDGQRPTMVDVLPELMRAGVASEALEASRMIRRDIDPDDPEALVDALLPGAQRVVVTPLRADGQSIGLLLGEWTHGSRLPRWTADALAQIAVHGAFALRTGRLLHDLDRLAQRDPLTGLGNRRSFNDVLEREMARARRDGTDLGLALFDVDHFKAVNDEHGHQVGDQVLRCVARALEGDVRGADLASRFGGEEFVVLLPGASADRATHTADRLRLAVAASPAPVPVTISAGVATFPAHAATGAQLIALADRALYEAKRSGRNRVVAAPDHLDATERADVAEVRDRTAHTANDPGRRRAG
jgi:two-component system cell cycle response regulator